MTPIFAARPKRSAPEPSAAGGASPLTTGTLSAAAEPTDAFIVTASDPTRLAQLKEAVQAHDPTARITHELPIIGGFSIEARASAASLLKGLGAVDDSVRVHRDETLEIPAPPADAPVVHPLLDTVGPSLGLDRVWSQGIKGKGVGIAIIDSGIAEHPDLKGRITAFRDLAGGIHRPHDENGHGTHVASIAAGSGRNSKGICSGVAPEAHLVGVKVTDELGHGRTSDFIAGIQWAVDNRRTYNIRVMNLSFGHRIVESARTDPTVQAVEAAVAAGLVVTVAAGNRGPDPSTLTAPGNAPSAITVGGLDDKGTVTRDDDVIGDFSSRGPSAVDGFTKPDLIAPGADIKAAHNRSNGYIFMTGTSMAAPVVAGTAALILGARPDLTPAQVKALLVSTARPLPGLEANTQGHGVVSPFEAVTAARQHAERPA